MHTLHFSDPVASRAFKNLLLLFPSFSSIFCHLSFPWLTWASWNTLKSSQERALVGIWVASVLYIFWRYMKVLMSRALCLLSLEQIFSPDLQKGSKMALQNSCKVRPRRSVFLVFTVRLLFSWLLNSVNLTYANEQTFLNALLSVPNPSFIKHFFTSSWNSSSFTFSHKVLVKTFRRKWWNVSLNEQADIWNAWLGCFIKAFSSATSARRFLNSFKISFMSDGLTWAGLSKFGMASANKSWETWLSNMVSWLDSYN